MNWKIILAGGALITVMFVSFFGFQLIKSRNISNIAPLAEPDFSTTTFEDNILPPQAKKAIEREVKGQNQLLRGKVTTYNDKTNSFTIAMEQKQPRGNFEVVGLIDIKIDGKLINKFLCWPEYSQTTDGKQIDVKQAYFSLNNDSFLFMKGETKKNISDLSNYLSNNSYVFAMLTTPLTNELSVIKDTNGIGQQYVKELAILGCNETN